jgi:SRSO17 transposase
VQYVSGLLRLEEKRNITHISRKVGIESQNMQQFISDSPWSGPGLLQAVQAQIKQHPVWEQEAILVIDESADEKAGETSAGAGRQYNGRLGKVDICQVGVFAALVTPEVNVWLDGELFILEKWFEAEATAKRKQVGIPDERFFQTKPQLAWQIIQRAQANGVPFVAVAMDDLYGRNWELCAQLDRAGIEYYGDIPANTGVYLEKPTIEWPLTKRGKRSKRYQVVSGQRYEVRQLQYREDLKWVRLTLRPCARGELKADFARCRVWLVNKNGQPYQRWLLFCRQNKQMTYALSNAAAETSLETMARRKSHRYFIERSNQDAKSELGWGEFEAIKYRAWEHHLALTILASWFIADTRLDWMMRHQRDPALLWQLETDVLPLLSVGNVRELFRAALPLPQSSLEETMDLVIEHLINRTRSRNSCLRKQRLREDVPET